MDEKVVKLTAPQSRVFMMFKENAKEGLPPPTYKEICERFGWSSTAAARDHIRALVRKGVLKAAAEGSGRPGAYINKKMVNELPLRAPEDTAKGFERGVPVEVPRHLLPEGEGFLLQAVDASMAGKGVLEGDIVVVQSRGRASAGALVVVESGGKLRIRLLLDVCGSFMVRTAPVARRPRSEPLRKEAIRGMVVGLMRRLDGGSGIAGSE